MHFRIRRWPLALGSLVALGTIGCSFPSTKGANAPPSPPETVQAQVARFRASLAARGGAPITAESAEMMLFTSAFQVTVNSYVDPVDPTQLIDAAIGGMDGVPERDHRDSSALVRAAITAMVASIDSQGSYLGPELYEELDANKRGQLAGPGLEIAQRKGVVTVVAPLEGGPAARAGVRPGDQLIAVDGVSTEGLDLLRIVRALRGPVGSDVILTVRRSGSAELVNERLPREVITLQSVRAVRLDRTHGYLRIAQFGEHAAADVDDALDTLRRTGSLHGLVLDLRHSSGGLFTQIVKVADLFLDAGVIVQTRGRGEAQTFTASPGGAWRSLPIVVLVDGDTVAGSEILAAALQANRRAVIVGAPTFGGRGTLQTILPLTKDSALRLTTSRAFSASGSAIDLGVQPDVIIDAKPGEGLPAWQHPEEDAAVATALGALSSSETR